MFSSTVYKTLKPFLIFWSILTLIGVACSSSAPGSSGVPSSNNIVVSSNNNAPAWPPTGPCPEEGKTYKGPDGTFVICQNGNYLTATGTPQMIVPNTGTVPVSTPQGQPAYTPQGTQLPPASTVTNDNNMVIYSYDNNTSWAMIFTGVQNGNFFFANTAAEATTASTQLGVTVVEAASITGPIIITSAIAATAIGIMLFAAKYTVVAEYDVTAIPHPAAPTLSDVDWANLETVLMANEGTHEEAQRLSSAISTRQQQCGGRLNKACDGGNSNGRIEFKAGVNGQVVTIAGALVLSTNVAFVWAEAPLRLAGGNVPPGGAIRLLGDQYINESEIVVKKVWMMSSKIGNGDMSPYYLNADQGMQRYYEFCASRNLTIDIATIWLPI